MFRREKVFKPLVNSLLTGTLLTKKEREKWNIEEEDAPPPSELIGNLGSISALYLYTNTPPHGYGSQAPKVAETINRAYSYNLKRLSKVQKLEEFKVERMQWEREDGPFPHNQIHGNFLAPELKSMAEKFLMLYHPIIDKCAEDTIQKAMYENADVLTKGRQTLDSLTDSSVTASVAFKRMHELYRNNLNVEATTCLEWIECFFRCLELPELKVSTSRKRTVDKRKYCRITKTYTKVPKTIKIPALMNIKENKEIRAWMMKAATKFASYIKHKERGKLKRRAIASANMILRMFLHIIEEFHLELGKHIEGSTISIGGEEKKRKIISNLNTASLHASSLGVTLQGTEDATKWNEGLAPSAFAIMHKVFFDQETRDRLNLPSPSEFGSIFSQIATRGNFLMALKTVQLGEGPISKTNLTYNRLSWDDDINRFNEQTKEWLKEILRRGIDDGYTPASPGMLMGMLNAGSTTLGLLPVNHLMNQYEEKVVTLRSSDDSMSVYIGINLAHTFQSIIDNRRNLGLIGINLSKDKSFFFKEGFGEFTSWYMDGDFTSQFGVETSSIRPQGKNPPDDHASIAKGTATALGTLTMNHLGATSRLKLGAMGVNRLWRIQKTDNKREGVSSNVLLLSDGGRNLWNCCNCHLEESSLKEREAQTIEEKEYLLRVRNPNNPFSEEPEEEISYNKDLGGLQLTIAETPRTAFHYVKRSNRTVTTNIKRDMFLEEKSCAEVINIIKTVDPTTNVDFPNEATRISKHLFSILHVERAGHDLSESEESLFLKAMDILKNGIVEDDDDETPGDLDRMETI